MKTEVIKKNNSCYNYIKKSEQMLAIFFILYYDIKVTTNNCLSFWTR